MIEGERFRKEDWTALNRGYTSKETSRVERRNKNNAKENFDETI